MRNCIINNLQKVHLRVTIFSHCSSPRLVFLVVIVFFHSHVLKLVHQFVLLQGIQAAVKTVLLAWQHFPMFWLHVVEVIIHLDVVRHSVYVHVEFATIRRHSSVSIQRSRQSGEAEEGALGFVRSAGRSLGGDFQLTYLRKSKGNHTKLCFCEKNPPQKDSEWKLVVSY